MPQHEVEVILMRQLASYLTTPVFLTGPDGDLLYFNEPAEPILGRRFDETGAMAGEELWQLLRPTTQEGTPLPIAESPLRIARREQRPTQRQFWIQGMDGIARKIENTAFPLVGQGGRLLGTVALLREIESS